VFLVCVPVSYMYFELHLVPLELGITFDEKTMVNMLKNSIIGMCPCY
jgi:hypothetical protein